MHERLPPENVFGHAKKVTLLQRAIATFKRDLRRPLRILDIGCGSGYAVTRFLGGLEDNVLGIDSFCPNIAYAKAHFQRAGLSFECVDVTTLSLEGKQYDVVVMADVLEHLEQPEEILHRVADLLSPEARLLVTVPNGWGPFEIESAICRAPLIGPLLLRATDLFVALMNKSALRGAWTKAARDQPSDLPYNKDSGHVQFYSRKRFIEMVERNGFTCLAFHKLSFLSGPFSNYLFAPWQSFCKWNARVADRLPAWLVSAWFFEFKRQYADPRRYRCSMNQKREV